VSLITVHVLRDEYTRTIEPAHALAAGASVLTIDTNPPPAYACCGTNTPGEEMQNDECRMQKACC
jgi:hypothetical protein